jgi:hypothetical protein
VVENLRIPVRGLFTVMLLFTILIGPVNIYVLKRLRRRIWLLWTVPAFSLLTCTGVVGFMFLSEGWQPHARAEGVTILDETSQRATSIGWLGLYSPLTPAGGLHFSYDTELTPHLVSRSPGSHSGGSQLGRTINWTDDQDLSSGWLTPRLPAHFLLRTSAGERPERVLVEKEKDGSLGLTNALKVPIAAIWVADATGKIHTATALTVDGKTPLTPTAKQAAGTAPKMRQAFTQDWLLMVDSLSAHPEEYLRPGCYIALLDAAPFLEQGVRDADTGKTRSVVFGIMKAR